MDPGTSPGGDEARVARLLLLLALFAALAQRGTENVAERRATVGRAVLGDRLLLLGNFQRLDRNADLARLLVELRHAGIDLLADRETLGALLGAVTRKIVALDEGGEIGPDDLHVDAVLLHLHHLAGDPRVALQVARLGERVVLELLHAERDALLLDIDVEHLRLHVVALLVLLDHLLARTLPVEIGEMDHAVHVAVEPEEQAELGLVLDLALDFRARRIFLHEDLPRIADGLLEAERDAALDRIDFQHLHLDFLRGGDDLARMHVLLGPGHLGDGDRPRDAGLDFHERPVVRDVGDAALQLRTERKFRLDVLPGIVLQLLHAERDAVGLVVDLDDLDRDLLADVEHFGRVVDAPPRDVGDMQEAVDAAEIHEGAIVGDVLHHAVDDLALFEVLHQLLALFGAGLFQNRAP